MKRLARWFRRSRPTAGGPVGPLPELAPPVGSVPWHLQQAHQHLVHARLGFGRWLIGRRVNPADVAELARHAAHHLLAFAAGLEAGTVRVDVPDDLSDLDGGAQ